MELVERIKAFSQLGIRIRQLIKNENKNVENEFQVFIDNISNEWFTSSNIYYTLDNISNNLDLNILSAWLDHYPKLKEQSIIKKIGLVTAGNIPLVGFHDVLCILISGHKLIIKHSSKDEKLMTWLLNLLTEIEPRFKDFIIVVSRQLKNFDSVIATGSDNTSKYFEYYFAKYPHIIRKNRNSIAILTGNESDNELQLLADDMLLYFGLGCRNVSKIYIPKDFDIQRIFKAVYHYEHLMDHNKYMNNYTYNKSIYLMNKVSMLDNGFLILKEDSGMSSPISVIYYEKYNNIDEIKERINSDKDKIQCVVAKEGIIEGSVGFGEAQKPKLHDYADNVDTLKFLLSLE